MNATHHRLLSTFVVDKTGCSDFRIQEVVQELWSRYGQILRLELKGCDRPSVIVKFVDLAAATDHPKGWNTDLSHQRKVKSYEVEWAWYEDYAHPDHPDCRMAAFLGAQHSAEGGLLMLEDLNLAGFPIRKSSLSMEEIKSCLSWLAHFHGYYMRSGSEGLWDVGTYWHLDTRPDEWQAMKPGVLKDKAEFIDATLNAAQFQTLVHGDAKLANFCFSETGAHVAAVDFQYVGGGCGIKDVAYFLSSCLSAEECFEHEEALLDYYFATLSAALPQGTDGDALEAEWRRLYPYAWADFVRFLEGWMPGHYKLNAYARAMVDRVLNESL